MANEIDNVSVQKQLNTILQQRVATQNTVTESFRSQLQLSLQIKAVLENLSTSDLEARLGNATQAFESMAAAAAKSADIGVEAMKRVAEQTTKTSNTVSSAKKNFALLANSFFSIGKFALQAGKSVWEIGKAILSIPLKIFDNLMHEAASYTDTSFAKAMESIRKEFGSFRQDISKNVVGAYKTMRSQFGEMTGLSIWQVFESPAEQLEYLHEIASKAGSQMHQFGKELASSAGAIAGFEKGMGIGSENMRAFMDRAIVFGTDMKTQLNSAANYAIQLGAAFGMSNKVISRDVGSMMKDVRNFGTLTQKQMTIATVYTRKLGLEVKDLTGLIGQWDNFDRAAESAAMLSQAFGATIDSFKMMNEADPAKRVDMLRTSMAAAGKTAENMTRQELHLLASTAGLSDEAAKLAFSTKNQGLSYSEVEKQASKAEDAQLTQAKALKSLASNIERVVYQMNNISGFWNNFWAGFTRGFKFTREYQDVMHTLRSAMTQFFMAGMQVGKMFVSITPGVSGFFTKFADIFRKGRINELLYGFSGSLKDNVNRIGGIVGGFKKMFEGDFSGGFSLIKSSFSKFMNSAQVKPIGDSILKFGKWVMNMFGQAMSDVAKHAPEYINKLTSFLKDPKAFMESLKSTAGAGANQGLGIGASLIEAFSSGFDKNGPVMQALGDSVKSLASTVWDKIKQSLWDAFTAGGPKLWAGLGLYMFGPKAMATFMSASMSAVSTGASGMAQLSKGLVTKLAPLLANPYVLAAAAAVAIVAGAVVLAKTSMKNAAEKLQDQADDAAFFKKLEDKNASYENKIALLNEERMKQAKKAEEEAGSGILNFIRGGMSEQEADARAKMESLNKRLQEEKLKADRSLIVGTPEYQQKITKAAEENKKRILDAMGPITVENASEKLKKVSDLAKSVMGKDFNIAEKMKMIQEKLSSVDFSVFKDKSAENQVNQSLSSLESIKAMFGVVSDLGILSNKASSSTKSIDLSKVRESLLQLKTFGNTMYTDLVDKTFITSIQNAAVYAQSTAVNMEELSTRLTSVFKSIDDINAAASSSDATGKGDSKKSVKSVVDSITSSLQALTDSDLMTKSTAMFEKFNKGINASVVTSTLNVTTGIVKSVNELNTILGSSGENTLKIGEKLKKFADNSGLGKSGTYEIKNKGITLKLDLKVVMDAGEVEKAIVLRKESILFDTLFDQPGLTEEHQLAIDKVNAKRGGV